MARCVLTQEIVDSARTRRFAAARAAAASARRTRTADVLRPRTGGELQRPAVRLPARPIRVDGGRRVRAVRDAAGARQPHRGALVRARRTVSLGVLFQPRRAGAVLGQPFHGRRSVRRAPHDRSDAPRRQSTCTSTTTIAASAPARADLIRCRSIGSAAARIDSRGACARIGARSGSPPISRANGSTSARLREDRQCDTRCIRAIPISRGVTANRRIRRLSDDEVRAYGDERIHRGARRVHAAEMAAVIAAIDPLEAQTEAFLRSARRRHVRHRARRRDHVPAAPRRAVGAAARVFATSRCCSISATT